MKMLFFIRRYLYQLFYLFDLALGNKPKVFVLCYHSISSDWFYGVKLSEFKKQINYLKGFYNFISPEQFEKYLQGKLEINNPSVLLTFDDGYEDILQIKSFLKDQHIKPILFLLSDPAKVYRSEVATDKKMLTDKQILSLKNSGWELGSHGATHIDFWSIGQSLINKEVTQSKKTLTHKFGQIKYFAYPKGRYTNAILKNVSKSGYKLGFSMNDDFISQKTNKLIVPRVGINSSHDFEEFTMLFSPSVVQFRKLCKMIKLERTFI